MKPTVYAEIPAEFDQCTQYVVQLEPVEMEDCVFYGVEIRELPPQEDKSGDSLPEGWSANDEQLAG